MHFESLMIFFFCFKSLSSITSFNFFSHIIIFASEEYVLPHQFRSVWKLFQKQQNIACKMNSIMVASTWDFFLLLWRFRKCKVTAINWIFAPKILLWNSARHFHSVWNLGQKSLMKKMSFQQNINFITPAWQKIFREFFSPTVHVSLLFTLSKISVKNAKLCKWRSHLSLHIVWNATPRYAIKMLCPKNENVTLVSFRVKECKLNPFWNFREFFQRP